MKIRNILLAFLVIMTFSCTTKNDVAPGSTYAQQILFYSYSAGVKTLASSDNPISLTATMADLGTTKEFQFMASLAKENTSKDSMTYTISASPEEVAKYNQKFGTNFPVFPDSLANLTKTLKIDSGNVSSNIGSANFKISDSLADDQPYLYAVKITPSINGVPVQANTQTILYRIQKSVPSVNTTIALTRTLYLQMAQTIGGNTSSVSDIGTTFTMEGLINIQQFRSATDVGDAQISTFMGTEGATLIRFGDAGINGNQLQVNGRTIATFNTNQWYHVALVQTTTTSTIYVNGNQVSSFSATGSLGQFYVGRSYNGNRGIVARMAEIRLWNVARSADDIKLNMLGVGTSTPGLYAYWKMNQVVNREIPDESGHTSRNLTMWGQGNDPSQQTITLFNETSPVTIQ